MLVPAGILVLLVLAAIALDSAVVLLAQRDLADRTASVAVDVANAAVDDQGLYGDGSVELRQDVADALVRRTFDDGRVPRGYDTWHAEATTDGRTVTVEAEAVVRYVLAPAIPGVHRTATVRARSTAEAAGG
jgi:hypothetical protein